MRKAAIFVVVAVLSACGGSPAGVQRAETLLARGDFDGATKAADQELNRYPKHPTLWRVKIRAAMGAGDNARAVELYMQWHKLRHRYDPKALEVMAMTTMWQGLRVPSADIKVRTIQAIERLELEKLARDVGDRIADDDDIVAAAASIALLRSHPQAPRVATQMLRSDQVRARVIAVSGIARKIKSRARDDIVAALDDASPLVRSAAVRGLAAMKSKKDRKRFIALARNDKDGGVRAAAIHGLRMGKHKNIFPIARAAVSDTYLGARLAAVYILAESDPGRAILAKLARTGEPFVALRAAVALKKHDTDVVERALRNPAWTVRAAGLNAVAQLASKTDAIAIAEKALKDVRIEVRLAAARALDRLGRKGAAMGVYFQALEAERDMPRLQAAIALIRMDDSKGHEALRKLSKSPTISTRMAAVSAHRYLDRPTIPLVHALADETGSVRIEAAETLLLLLKK